MEAHFLAHQVEGQGPSEFRAEPWFNAPGDCIVFQTVDEAVVAERIDEILTIYHSAIDDRPIGFQIKGVQALIRKFGWDGLAFESQGSGDSITGVSITALLLAAYDEGPRTLGRRHAYSQVMDQPPHFRISRDELLVG